MPQKSILVGIVRFQLAKIQNIFLSNSILKDLIKKRREKKEKDHKTSVLFALFKIDY